MSNSGETTPLRFVTSVYGKKYGGMLLTLLYSIHRSNPDATVTIFWQDVSPAVRSLERVFPRYTFIDTDYVVKGDIVKRISHKMLLWFEAVSRYPNEHLVFLDVDMLVRKNIGFVFDGSFDIAFTHKVGEVYPLNTGAFFAVASPATEAFFKRWYERTETIVNDPVLKRISSMREHHYGGPDQMALCELIKYVTGVESYRFAINDHELRAIALPCARFNETNSCPLRDETHIIHYKGGWHSILLDGTDFTSRRPKIASWELFIFYLSTYKEAVAFVVATLGTKASEDTLGIRIPFYLDAGLNESVFSYRIFKLYHKLMNPIRDLWARLSRFVGAW